ncbi:hypothetical protein GNF83_17240, partial [Clostridium perfringens]|nr:hypothetical protein [Clostridium perfringens]
MVQSLLNSQVGMEVNINRGGPFSSRGRLLAIKEDHLVVKTDEHGPVYYQIENIESAGVDSREDRYALPSNVMEGDWCEDEVCLEDVYYNMRYYVVDI